MVTGMSWRNVAVPGLLTVLICSLPLIGAGSAAAVPAPTDGVWPLEPRPEVVRGFDPPAQRWEAGHRGVDLRGSPGQGVHSAMAGRVSFAGRIAGRGIVVVGHGETRTTYQPVAASVSVGEQVAAGERVGTLLILGSHCWPVSCLHWGWIHGETYLDPLTIVGAAPVRLLPLHGSLEPSGPDGADGSLAGEVPESRRQPARPAPALGSTLLPVAAPVAVVVDVLAAEL